MAMIIEVCCVGKPWGKSREDLYSVGVCGWPDLAEAGDPLCYHNNERGAGDSMTFVIKPFTDDLIPAVKDLNSRLTASGAPPEFRFFEHPVSKHLPKISGRKIYEEYFVVFQDGVARGGYAFKHQYFSINGQIRSVGLQHWTISEGMIDKAYSAVALQMLRYVLREQPLMYALGMGGYDGGPLPRILEALGWSLRPIPFRFKVHHPQRFFKEIRAIRQNVRQKMLMDLAVLTGAGGLTLRLLQGVKAKRAAPDVRAVLVQGFSQWADGLWEQCKEQYAMIAVRDSETLNILYPADSKRFLCYKVTRGDAIIGWFVLLDTPMHNNKHFGNLRVGSIVDCLALPEDASAVIGAATGVLEKRKVDLIVSNQSHAAWSTALGNAGFLPGSSNFLFAASKDLAELLRPFEVQVSRSHFTRGDGDGPLHL